MFACFIFTTRTTLKVYQSRAEKRRNCSERTKKSTPFVNNEVSNQSCTSSIMKHRKTSKHLSLANKQRYSTLRRTCTERIRQREPSKHGRGEKSLPWHQSQPIFQSCYGAGCANKWISVSTSFASAGKTHYYLHGQQWKVTFISTPLQSHHQAHR